jgi:signal recognition particle subunit SRP19
MIIYPSNIDSKITKRMGRKISKKNSVDSPRVAEVHKALMILGEKNLKLESDASYPRDPWRKEGRVGLERKGRKRTLLKGISKEIRRMRTPS